MNQPVDLSPGSIERQFVAMIDQESQTMRQNLQTATGGGYTQTAEGLSQIIGYLSGIDSFVSTYAGITALFESQGLYSLSNRISQLRAEVSQQVGAYQIKLAQLRTSATPSPQMSPLSTPEGIQAFEQHLQDLAQLNKAQESSMETSRNLILNFYNNN